jgi:hypothetical protein
LVDRSCRSRAYPAVRSSRLSAWSLCVGGVGLVGDSRDSIVLSVFTAEE